jgi:hypothetical protein
VKCRDSLPIAEILEKRRRSILWLVGALQRTWIRHYLRHALRQPFDPVPEHTAQYHDPVFLKVGDRRIRNVHLFSVVYGGRNTHVLGARLRRIVGARCAENALANAENGGYNLRI